jgi:hypothetical protein
MVTTGAAWKCTAKETGYYTMSTLVATNNVAFTTGNVITIDLYKNGVFYAKIDREEVDTSDNPSAIKLQKGTTDIQLNKGDYFDLRYTHTRGADITLATITGLHYITVRKVG